MSGCCGRVRKHVDPTFTRRGRQHHGAIRVVEDVLALVCFQCTTRDHVPEVQRSALEGMLMLQGFSLRPRLSEHELNPAVCDMAVL
jgi:hypothetical protein